MDNSCNQKGFNLLLTCESTLSCYWRLQTAALLSDCRVCTFKKDTPLHLLLFGHYVCLVLKIFNFSVFPPYAMWLNVISINLMQLSKRGTFVETAYPRLPSNRRTRQSVELFTSVADERTHDSACKFCLMLCKILNGDLLNVFGFGSHHRNSFSNFKPCFED